MPESKVLAANQGPGYFAVKRFDREGNRRIHLHTACGLLHADFRLPSLGYEELIKGNAGADQAPTRCKQMFLRMVFNVYAHNRDDHTKNHGFLMDNNGEWRLSPAYDVTFSDGPGGEHTLDLAGEGKNPGLKDIQKVGHAIGLSNATINECVDRVRVEVNKWSEFADRNGIPKKLAEGLLQHFRAENKKAGSS